MDGAEACAVASGHVLVKALDRVRAGEVTELLVHVVRARTRIVPEPDAEDLHLERLLLEDLNDKRVAFDARAGGGGDGACQQSRSACLLRAARDEQLGKKNTHDVDADDLAIRLLNLLEFPAGGSSARCTKDIAEGRDAPEEVPETRLGDDLVRSNDAHAVDFGSRLGLSGQVAPDDLVFGERHPE